MPESRSDHYGKRDRSPDLKPGDLTRGLHWLETEAERGSPSARAVLAELERLKVENRKHVPLREYVNDLAEGRVENAQVRAQRLLMGWLNA